MSANRISITTISTNSVTPPLMQEPATESQESLTIVEESAPVLEETTQVSIERPLANPYPDQTPTELLNRMFLILTTNWVPGFTADLNFPGSLNLQATIQKVLTRFRWFRADVEIEIKINSTPYHQGSLMVGYIPQWVAGAPLPLPTSGFNAQLFLLSGCNGMVMCASSQDGLKFTIPYVHPNDWLDYSTPGILADSRIATVFIRELNTLVATSAGIAASVPILVYARFVNSKVAGFMSQMSDKPSRESAAKAKGGFDVKTGVSVASKLLRKVPVIGEGYGIIADLFNTFAGDLSKPASTQTSTPIISSYQPEDSLAHGNTYADQLTLYPNGKLTQAETFCGITTSHITLNKLAQRPMLIAIQTFTTAITSQNILAIPQALVILPGTGCVISPIGDWLQNLSYAFRYWRGSIKYSFHFCLPAFYSFRVCISLSQQPAAVVNTCDIPCKIVDIKGDCWVDFSVPYLYATTWMDTQLFPTPLLNNAPTITVQFLTPIVGSSSISPPLVYMNVFRSGGEDTQFSGLRGVRLASGQVSTKPTHHSDVSIEKHFSVPFEGMISGTTQSLEQGFVAVESVHTVSDCLKRTSNTIPTTSNPTTPLNFVPGVANVNWATLGGEPYHYFSAMFRFWRGSRVFKHVQPCINIAMTNDATNVTHGDGVGVFFAPGTNALLYNESVLVPYLNTVPWVPMVHAPGQVFDASVPNNVQDVFGYVALLVTTGSFTVAAGDDFMLMYPVPFFSSAFAPIPFVPLAAPNRPPPRRHY